MSRKSTLYLFHLLRECACACKGTSSYLLIWCNCYFFLNGSKIYNHTIIFKYLIKLKYPHTIYRDIIRIYYEFQATAPTPWSLTVLPKISAHSLPFVSFRHPSFKPMQTTLFTNRHPQETTNNVLNITESVVCTNTGLESYVFKQQN